jgi:hypothetical protein
VGRRVRRRGCTITGILLLCAAAAGAEPVVTTPFNAQNSGATPTPIPRPTPHRRPLPPLTVTNTNYSGPGSLRQALTDAQNDGIISFAPALHGQTVTLTNAELVIDKNVTIDGPGPDMLVVSRSFSNSLFRIFHVTAGHNVAIQGLTISGGSDGYNDVGGASGMIMQR